MPSPDDGELNDQPSTFFFSFLPELGQVLLLPNQFNALLISFLLSSDAEIFVGEHRLSTRVGAKNVRKKLASDVYAFRLSFRFRMLPVAGWVGGSVVVVLLQEEHYRFVAA